MMMNRFFTLFGAVAVLILMTSCSSQLGAIAVGTGAMPVHERPKYDAPAQVVYRIDDKRYFSMTNYADCSKRGDITYIDERTGVKTLITGVGIWLGQYRIEPSDTHIALPAFGCSDKGCYLMMEYSTDGGRQFNLFHSRDFGYRQTTPESRKRDELAQKQTEVVVKGNQIYVRGPTKTWVSQHTFDPGMDREDVMYSGTKKMSLSEFPAVRTPSLQDRFTCDTTIKPKNLSEAE